MSDASTNPVSTGRKRTTLLLSLLALGMFGFGFALVPLYDLLCQVTGIQSIALRSQTVSAEAVATGPVSDRWVTVKFDTSIHPALPWAFRAVETRVRVQPGKMYQVDFLADNQSNAQVTGQAIPSVVPWQATPYFSKLECFCFNQQTLTAGESAVMPLRFVVSPDLPAEISSITLSYNLLKLNQDREDEQRVDDQTTTKPIPAITITRG